MPLTPEDKQAQTGAEEVATRRGNEERNSRVSTIMDSKYLKPVGAVLVALGAGYLVRLFRKRKSTSEQKKGA